MDMSSARLALQCKFLKTISMSHQQMYVCAFFKFSLSVFLCLPFCKLVTAVRRKLPNFAWMLNLPPLFSPFCSTSPPVVFFRRRRCFQPNLFFLPVCDNTKNLNDTKSETFFRYQIFSIPNLILFRYQIFLILNPILFSIPNFFEKFRNRNVTL